ncbi:MAG: methylated-DNA--[protein]-cysteine S-methyltransferase [Anaerolineales bacterium]|jgi:AraC family transcriptional regulator of adaptative response/methylated-DNA-[protein]-cysteine methyltransferase
MTNFTQLSEDYQRIAQAISFLEDNARRQPDLAEVAAHVGLSEYHFQRLFSRWAGISPKRFLQFLTKENAKALLARTSVLSAAYEAGLSGPGRLHDLIVHCEAVTPGEYRSKGAGVDIVYGFHPTPFGECLLALTRRGICFLAFVDGDRQSAMQQLKLDWANATIHPDPDRTRQVVERVFRSWLPHPLSPQEPASVSLHLHGTNYQIKVWEALLRIPPGAAISYETLSDRVGSTKGARAVGNAVSRNPVAWLIPCHRVLQKSGGFGDYRYGSARKQAILGWELASLEK